MGHLPRPELKCVQPYAMDGTLVVRSIFRSHRERRSLDPNERRMERDHRRSMMTQEVVGRGDGKIANFSPKEEQMRTAIVLLLAGSLVGCATYRAQPLSTRSTLPDRIPDVTIDSRLMPLPELAAHTFDPTD